MERNILLCVSGGIAAYKAIDLASRLSKAGYHVKTVLTDSARQFVSGINFAAITSGSVHTDLFGDPDPIPHIHLADWADLVVVAPATANVMAKAARGLADDLLGSLLLAHSKPVLFVPAMNVNMYGHPATRENAVILVSRGNHVLEPETGLLACGYEGKGKYPPNEEVVYAIRCYLDRGRDLTGKKALVTAGATSEPLDPMRTITNRSSGKMGLALARALALRGAETTLIHGLLGSGVPYYLARAEFTPTASEMRTAVLEHSRHQDIILKCAAVSDYKPVHTSENKLKKGGRLQLDLEATPDILAELGANKPKGQILVGFAAETENLIPNAQAKLLKKNLDLICVNHLNTAGSDITELTLVGPGKAPRDGWPVLGGDKFDVANLLVDKIITL
jgi:phosphopantothenoylcysteine decarboxylase/phosphopantothenate--cysteine ligase